MKTRQDLLRWWCTSIRSFQLIGGVLCGRLGLDVYAGDNFPRWQMHCVAFIRSLLSQLLESFAGETAPRYAGPPNCGAVPHNFK